MPAGKEVLTTPEKTFVPHRMAEAGYDKHL